ncbi:MAG: TadE/TadG family type IV pilus assembly protein [Gammaproteobacteria bacterium]|jgi:Flp pilus assembly protein TadG
MPLRYHSPGHQKGLAAVETALVAAVVLVVLFAVFEIGRVFFVANALEEATRRGARVAAVCQVNDPAIVEIALFNNSGGGGTSPLVYGLTSANIRVDYISNDGTVITDPVGNFTAIDAVRVSVQNYQHELIIPFFMRTISMPAFATTFPRESLGVTREGFTRC